MGLYNNRIVVKVGTSTLTNDAGKSDLRTTDRLVCVLSDIQNMGYEVVLVSSGAIAVGRNKLNMTAKPDSMRMKQAAAAVGQCSLMYLYDKFFGDYDKTVAQILLNADDIEEEEKKENSKISGTCHCDCAVFRYPACHCSWITEEANTGMERKTTGRMETKTGKSAGR